MPIRPTGVARYWQDCTFGILNLEGSVVFPWRVLDFAKPTIWTAREVVLTKAIEKGLEEGFPLHQFPYVVVIVIPNLPSTDANGKKVWPIDTGAQGIDTRGGSWSCRQCGMY